MLPLGNLLEYNARVSYVLRGISICGRETTRHSTRRDALCCQLQILAEYFERTERATCHGSATPMSAKLTKLCRAAPRSDE